MSDYTEWANKKTWTIQEAKGGTDLEAGDILEFSLGPSDSSIQISKVQCTHLQRPSFHRGSLWTGVCTGAGGRAEGTMQGTAGQAFEIVSDASGTILTCNLIKTRSSTKPFINTSDSDGACWTAKGG